MKEQVLKLMLQDFSQEKIAFELSIPVNEVRRLQEEIVVEKVVFNIAIENIRQMELEAYNMALNWQPHYRDDYKILLRNLENARL